MSGHTPWKEIKHKTNQELGTEFEEAFAEEMGLTVVRGSGNQWHSKLDVKGGGARWSLKATRAKTYTISADLIEEVEKATQGFGGTGEIGLHAFELNGEWFVLARARDFKEIAAGEYKLVTETKTDAKRKRAAVPELLRDEEDE